MPSEGTGNWFSKVSETDPDSVQELIPRCSSFWRFDRELLDNPEDPRVPPAKSDYAQFKLLYQAGLRRLDEVRVAPANWTFGPAADHAKRVAEEALERLKSTEFGQSLIEADPYEKAFTLLNYDLGRWVSAAVNARAVKDTDPVFVWSSEDCYEAERKFRFAGEMGGIFDYFRDNTLSLDTSTEEVIRGDFVSQLVALSDELDALLGHVGIHLTYKPQVVKQMEDLRRGTKRLNLELASPKDTSLDGPNPLQAGATIIRRQFVHAVSRLCFELFGCMSTRALDHLLDMKSKTVATLCVTSWSECMAGGKRGLESRNRTIRGYIQTTLRAGVSLAKRNSWVTAPVLIYFSENRSEWLDG